MPIQASRTKPLENLWVLLGRAPPADGWGRRIYVYIHKYIYVYCQYICICIRRYVYVYIYVYLRLRCMPCPEISTKSTNMWDIAHDPWRVRIP